MAPNQPASYPLQPFLSLPESQMIGNNWESNGFHLEYAPPLSVKFKHGGTADPGLNEDKVNHIHPCFVLDVSGDIHKELLSVAKSPQF